MAGYLENYGTADAQREKKVKLLAISAALIIVTSATAYFTFRDFSEERKITAFLDAVKRQDFKTAYTFWGCTQEAPCRDYSFEKFMEDWGPRGDNFKFATGEVHDNERCGTGYLAAVGPADRGVSLWVERSTGIVGYAPWSNCPERKLRLMKWLRMKFGRS